MDKQLTFRHRWFSFSVTYSSLLALLFALFLTLLVMWVALSAGTSDTGGTGLSRSGSLAQFVAETLRLPRILMAAMVGAALGGAGLILQSVIRNPLASPDIIGITSGASAAAVVFLFFFKPVLGIGWLPVFAIGGALSASLLIYVLAWRRGVSPMRLVLVGIGVSAAMSAIVTLLIAVSPESTSMMAYIWLTGSVYGTNWHDVERLFPWILVSFSLSLYFSRRMNAQELGDQTAVGLGVSLQGTRIWMLLLSVMMAAPAIAYAGAVSFVGLIAPHIARRLMARSFALLLPVTALTGACLVVLADLCGRLLFQPLDVPAGVFVSAIGAPFFIFLLYRQRF
ncbi:putative siderophore transport system permease protein YfhA [Vibrio aerogenes CECT 7868]|uniref:Putative siderophore transport system permease protein YfhA n=1 Tax=Vibrio aerogenes CECT 7868 TaxID=1216006 RepID=A0A1M6A5L8_9VIBR|nr:iron ABC transporter permease [Vibrio aerogenes]SHI31776.1 putative siderophore transport system permease protein YfhA [Vibrio aerogenes CECT 7868]